MLFRPRLARALVNCGKRLIPQYQAQLLEMDVHEIDVHAVLLFFGFIHFAIAHFLSVGKIRLEDINPILVGCALCVRQQAPNHYLGNNYIEDTMALVRDARQSTGDDPYRWALAYAQSIRHKIEFDEFQSTGFLTADTHALMIGTHPLFR